MILGLFLVACAAGVDDSTAVFPTSTSPATAVPPTNPPPTQTALPEPPATEKPTAVAVPSMVQVQVADHGPALAALEAGWTKVEPGGDTRCAHDTPFAYWLKPGTVDKLLIYFEGGGGCWDAQTCAPGSNFYDANVGDDEDPTRRGGIFDLDQPENPFKDYHAVYIPSCNGDVYWGNKVQDYAKEDGSSLQIYHRGFVNAAAALDWAYENIPNPESVFVTGCSAGSVGSRVHAPFISEQYPDTAVTQLGDSLAFVFGRPIRLDDYGAYETMPSWIPELAAIQRENGFLMAEYDTIIANHYPTHTFAQYNTAVDNVQVRFYTAVSGLDATGFATDLATHLSSIHAEVPNFRSFTAAGDVHCILPGAQFYSRETAGVRFMDWVTALAEGQDVANVQCETCQVDFGAN